MKCKNDIQKRRKNILTMKYRNFKCNRRVHAQASVLTFILIVFASQCSATKDVIDTQTVQPANEKWQDIQKNTTDESGKSSSPHKNSLTHKTKDDNIAFILNKPSKFDEHVDEEQYVDNPLLLLKLNASKTSSLDTNVTKTLSTTSANQTVANLQIELRPCANQSSPATAGNSTGGKCAAGVQSISMLDIDMNNENAARSVAVRKRNSATNETIAAESGALKTTSDFHYKPSSPAPAYEYKNATTTAAAATKRWSAAGSLATRHPKARLLLDTATKFSYRKYPPSAMVAAGAESSALLSFKLKKETENYRTFEKRIRRRNRVRRSLLQLPFNDVRYRPIHRRYYLQQRNDRIDLWTDAYDQHRRYVRFPLGAAGGGGGGGAELFRNAPLPNRPPPPVAATVWSSQQLPPQYAAYQQSLPPVPSMGPRSPRLVFRDPVEPGTLQAPYSPNGLQDLIAPEDNRGCGVSVAKQQTAQRRIVGGDEAGFGSFPWQAYIRIGSSRCGGTLVNRFHVVTAGHCVARATARQVQVTLGDYVINSAVEPLPAYTFGVRKINVHPYFKFTPQADRFDVAVLRLDRPVQYMPHIAPICLPEKDEDFLGQYGWAAGWGALQAGSRLRPKTLQAVDVPIIDNRQCERWHKSNGINVVIYEEMMCAGYRGGSKDSCQGDSGGPLMLEKTGRWYLIGIVSAGYSCAQRGQPGIYHRVAHTVDWISYVMNS